MSGLQDATTGLESALAPLVTRLSRHATIDGGVRSQLAAATTGPKRFEKGDCIIGEGDRFAALPVLCEGLVLGSRRIGVDAQQHLAVWTPGEVIDHEGYELRRANLVASAAMPSAVAYLSRAVVADLIQTNPSFRFALSRERALAARLTQEWMVGIGRRSAYERVAHLLCEVHTRLRQVKLVDRNGCVFPFTQIDLADAVGLSVVHTNRVLQKLRHEQLIDLAHGRLTILNWTALKETGGFDPAYLEPAL